MTDAVDVEPVMRRDRRGVGLIVLVGIGLLGAAYAIWAQGAQIKTNERAVRVLVSQRGEDRAQIEQLMSLVRALQQQVRDLGGTPLTQAPTPPASPQAGDPTPAGVGATPTSRATRTPAPSPRPSRTPRPGVSPTPGASPSPSRICIGPLPCIPPGGTS